MSLEALLQKLDYEPAQLGGVRTYLQHLLGGADLALVQAEDFKKNKLNEVKPVGLRSRLRAALHADPEASAAVTTAAPSLSVTAYAKDMASLRQVILLTRHGARFPISPYFGNQNWPGNMPDFWGTYKGNLTPVGVNDHIRNGAQFKEHYVDRLKLVDPKGLLSDTVFCRSTNTQRTILSAWSLLMAMFPKSCIRLEVDNDTQQKWVDNPDITDDDATVTIHVNLSLKEDTTKLKSHKTEQSKEAHWKDLKKHPAFQKWADDPKIKTLLDKIYEMTQESKLSPELQMIKRLKKAYVVHTNVVIDDYHGMLVLRNPKGLLLSPEEKQQFAQISHRTWQVKWTGGNPIRQKEIAVGTKSFLQQHFFKHMDDFVNKKTKNKFVYYSNHDGLVAASMSAMNVFNWDVPGFASYVILELHEPSPGKFEVGFKYNPSPIDIPLTGVPSLQLALEPTAIEHLKPGRIPLETFRKICFGN